ncbi:hypothetical protein ACF08M_07815 [Streptomyces sp. NPDC015032]|uniref:cyanobactin maturation protease PatG family protein n=1 Tax=Streptomyces sp. NPDC015032 TaxID=3364937 RepID=UPI0037028909
MSSSVSEDDVLVHSGREPCDHSPFVYAIGQIHCRFPNQGIEKEFAQVIGRTKTKGLTDSQAMREALALPENRCLARQLTYVLSIQGVEAYVLLPRYSEDYGKLIDALRPNPSPLDLDVVIGVRGPISMPDECNGVPLPEARFEQLYSFDRTSLVKAMKKPRGMTSEQFEAATEEVLTKILQIAENTGATHEARAANYVACRYAAVYTKTFESFANDFALASIDVHPSPVGETRHVMEFTLSYTDRRTDMTDRFSVLVDTQDMYPFLRNRLAPSL